MLLQDGPDASQGVLPLQIKAKLGQKAYTATRDRILRHMETFVEDIYDLHRLTRRQHHLEGILEDRERYVAELHRLTAPSAEPEGPEAAAEPEGAAEVDHFPHPSSLSFSSYVVRPLTLRHGGPGRSQGYCV